MVSYIKTRSSIKESKIKNCYKCATKIISTDIRLLIVGVDYYYSIHIDPTFSVQWFVYNFTCICSLMHAFDASNLNLI